MTTVRTAPALFTTIVPSVKLLFADHDTLVVDADSIDVRTVLSQVFGIPAAEVDDEMIEVATDELALDSIEGYAVDREETVDGLEYPVAVFARERMVSEVLSTLL